MATTTMNATEYLLQERRAYSLYTIHSRAIPSIDDGLKPAARRVLWMARDGKHYKSATLAGSAMPIHPHASPESSVNTLAAPFGNNIPLLNGDGAFGTLLDPKSYGASRYTSVQVSQFCKDVVFADIDLVPMKPNYDGTIEEPIHFIPLIPIVLLNPSEGVAVGFATNILPRSLDDIIMAQLMHLQKGKIKSQLLPKFAPIDAVAVPTTSKYSKHPTFLFTGKHTVKGRTIHITSLPYGVTHATLVEAMSILCDEGCIQAITDNSRNVIDVTIVAVATSDVTRILAKLPLTSTESENLNVIDFDHESILTLTPAQLIATFTNWRLTWYVKRYEKLRDALLVEIQKMRDFRTAVQKKINAVASKNKSRAELIDLLVSLGIVHTDYIASLPVYRFSEEEVQKVESKLQEAERTLQYYDKLINSEDERRTIYITELKTILKHFTQGKYAESAL